MIERSVSMGPLTVRQAPLSVAGLRHSYDLCIGVSSWESRAVTAFEQLPAFDAAWEVWAFSSNDSERASAKAACFERLKTLREESVGFLQLFGSLQYEKNFHLIQRHIATRRAEKGEPLSILLDMTCMPKKYILFILGMAYRNEYVRAIDFVYAEGAYKNSNAVDPQGLMSWSSSEGEWSSVQVPYLEAENFIPDARGLIVALGAEISASIPFIERYEPGWISLISVEDDPARINTSAIDKERRLLRELESLPITMSQVFALEDLLKVAENCRDLCREHRDMAVTGLAIGAKPHALGLGVAALSVPNFEIVCRLPSHYLSGDVAPTGQVYVYSTEDRFEPR